jgi:hypothetical protein
MRVKLLTFRYSATLGGFDDTPLTEFIRDKEVIAFREHFYTVNEVPHLSCIVHYQDAVVPQTVLDAAREIPARAQRASGSRPFERKQGAPDPCEGLDESERALFNHLREWPSKQAHEEGVPPYVICTNKQLVAIVRQRPESPTALGHIEGFGPGKVDRYGKALLKALHGQRSPESAGPAAPDPAPPQTPCAESVLASAPTGEGAFANGLGADVTAGEASAITVEASVEAAP